MTGVEPQMTSGTEPSDAAWARFGRLAAEALRDLAEDADRVEHPTAA